MKILLWLLILPFLFLGFVFIVMMLMIAISLLPFRRKKTFFIIRKNFDIPTCEPSDKTPEKIIDVQWYEKKD